MPITRVETADILIDACHEPNRDKENEQLYDTLRNVDIGAAYQEPPPETFCIGAEAVLRALETMLLQGSGTELPDLVLVETSLFPTQTRLGDPLRDFLVLQVRAPKDDADKDALAVHQAYSLVYPALHNEHLTVYYIPSFFREALTMQMLWSEHQPGAPAWQSSHEEAGSEERRARKTIDQYQATQGPPQPWKGTESAENVYLYQRARRLEFGGKPSERNENSVTREAIRARVALFHTLLHEHALQARYMQSFLWCLPIIGAGIGPQGLKPTESPSLGGLGAVFILTAYRHDGHEISVEKAADVGRCISYLMKDIFAPFLYSSARDMLATALKHARRSAVAAIMARNMSHNLGSHVLANIAVSEILVGSQKTALLLQYLQRRMDFIAQIATAPPSWCLSMPVKSVLTEFASNTLLLDKICRFAGLDRDKIDFAVRDVTDGQPGQDDTHQRFSSQAPELTGWYNDLQLELTHGSVGVHAFYSILENLIRNAARHGNSRWLDKIRQHGEIVDGSTNVKLVPTVHLSFDFHTKYEDGDTSWQDKYVKLEITDHVPTNCLQKVAGQETNTRQHLQNLLDAQVVRDDTGELVREGMGMKEIKLSAAFLRLIDPATVDEHTPSPPLVTVDWAASWREGVEDEQVDIGRLRFTLYLPRARIACVIGGELSKRIEADTRWRAAGFDAVTDVYALRERLVKGEVLRHAFLAVDARHLQPEDVAWLAGNRYRLPARIVFYGTASRHVGLEANSELALASARSEELPQLGTSTEFQEALWRIWVDAKWPKHKLLVCWSPGLRPGFSAYEDLVSLVDETPERPLPERPLGGAWLVFDHRTKASSTSRIVAESAYYQTVATGQGVLAQLTSPALAMWHLHQLRETAALRVVILDERLEARRSEKVTPEDAPDKCAPEFRTLAALWAQRRVSLLTYESAVKNFAKFVETLGKTTTFNTSADGAVCDVFIIHQGLLVSIQQPENSGLDNFRRGWAHLRTLARRIVLDTGQGEPTLAKSLGVPWIEYSNLTNWIVNRPGDKQGLCQVLFALRASLATPGV